ncbi:MAG TPA: ABC transporter ATP-binding protein [Rhodanobacteraceae bacterium]|jgi:lipopolysaccharide transport system ATP-binding protein|nr:ABC transporter ATP-binding protein [Rhodanobacteraceae bacterium]
MSSDAIITAASLGKCYQIYSSPAERLKQMVYPRLMRIAGQQAAPRFREFWALRGVDFEIKRGETVGILGRNGSGKTTLLQLLCGTLPPSEGVCEVQGRVAALLELGAGFKPEFTGRENVLINSAIIGVPEEQALARMDEVIAFSELGDVIDQPVKTYSSGMYVRLAFSAAIHVSPDILVVDEALAVGDARFQAKCFRRINELKNQGVTILFVSHATEQVAMHCTRALLLDHGRLIEDGHPREVCNHYLDLLFGQRGKEREQIAASNAEASRNALTVEAGLEAEQGAIAHALPEVSAFINDSAGAGFSRRPGYHDAEYRWGNGGAEILDYLLVSGKRAEVANLFADEEAELYMRVRFTRDIATPVYGFAIKNIQGQMLSGCNSRDHGLQARTRYRAVSAGQVVVCRFGFTPKVDSGDYLLSIGVSEDHSGDLDPLDRRYDSILIKVERRGPYFGIFDIGADCQVVRTLEAR